MLFSSLDSTIRKSYINNTYFIFVDTVGFIRDLPTTLIDAFKSTLDEIIYSDIILHVRDISNKQDYFQKMEVNRILQEIGIDQEDNRIIEVMNKVDLLNMKTIRNNSNDNGLLVSAITGYGIEKLKKHISSIISKNKSVSSFQ